MCVGVFMCAWAENKMHSFITQVTLVTDVKIIVYKIKPEQQEPFFFSPPVVESRAAVIVTALVFAGEVEEYYYYYY